MTYLISLFLTCILGYGLIPSMTEATEAHQRAAIRLGRRYCFFHTIDLTQSLTRVSGVVEVDFDSFPAHVIVGRKAGKVIPDHLLAAVRQIKGHGYHSTGSFEGE